MDLTRKEVDVVLQALECLTRDADKSEALADVFSAILLAGNEELARKNKLDRERKRVLQEGKQKELLEDISLIRAKVIQYKRTLPEETAKLSDYV